MAVFYWNFCKCKINALFKARCVRSLAGKKKTYSCTELALKYQPNQDIYLEKCEPCISVKEVVLMKTWEDIGWFRWQDYEWSQEELNDHNYRINVQADGKMATFRPAKKCKKPNLKWQMLLLLSTYAISSTLLSSITQVLADR